MTTAPINVYEKGDLVRVTGAFTNIAGDPIDPTTVSLFVTNPAGVTTEYVYGVDAEVVRVELGSFYGEISAAASGQWLWKWGSTGTGQAAEHGEFMVQPSAFVVEA